MLTDAKIKKGSGLKTGQNMHHKGLMLNITSGGSKSWLLRVQVKGGRRVEIGLGGSVRRTLLAAGRGLSSVPG